MSTGEQLFRIAELGRAPGIRALSYECREGPDAARREERHDSFCIALVRRGRFTYHLDGKARALGPGSFFLGNTGGEYSCSHDHDGGDDCLAFEYSADVLADVAREAGLRASSHTFFRLPALPSIPRVEPVIWQLSRGASVEEAAYEVAFAVMSELAGLTPPTRAPSARDFDRANDAMTFIEAHATSEDLALDDACRHVGASPFHFLRTFKSVVGITPHQYLVRQRVRHAAALLRDSALPVTEVALEAGFGDLSNFIRTFRGVYGRSPRAFRQAPSAIARFAK